MDAAPTYSILLADDHPVVRAGLANVIRSNEAYTIVAECGQGEEAYAKIKELQPAICLLDISMPVLNGLDLIARLKHEGYTNSKFIILTMYDDEEYFEKAMNLGVNGYLLKDNVLSEILCCLERIAHGGYYICPELSEYLISHNARQKEFTNENSQLQQLTPTEKKILWHIAQNQTSQEIADKLCISFRTVQNHRNNIAIKLDLKGHNRLLQFALDNKGQLEGVI